MPSIKEKFQTAMRESQAREDAIRKNPALANTPEVIKQYRHNGLIMVIIGTLLAIGDIVEWNMIGSVFIIFVATPIVFIPAGVYMMATGKNPFRKK